MAVQTSEEVRDLAGFEPEGFLVTSFFLNVDAGEFTSETQLATSFDSTIHQAESIRKDIEDTLSHDGEQSLRDDLAKIREFFADFKREDTNGVAIFSCSGAGFWQVIQMPTVVESQVHFGPRPYVSPIAAFLSHTKPTAILLTDKQRARIFTMKNGEVREWTDFEDWVPQRTSQGGWSQNRYQRRSDKFKEHHIDKAAELTLRLLQAYPFDWLITAGEVQAATTLEGALHPYLKDRQIGSINVRIDADAAEIIEKASELEEQVEEQHIAKLMGQVQEFAGADGRGTIGLAKTIDAANEQKIHILLVQQGFSHPGGECPACGLLTLQEEGACTACSGEIRRVDNVVDALVQKSFELGSIVEVATEVDALQPIECVGAVLYY